MALRYLGTDRTTDWLPGVPARDLTDEDIAVLELDVDALIGPLYESSGDLGDAELLDE